MELKTISKLRSDYEHEHQKAVIEWAELQKRRRPELALLYAIPNGGHRSKTTASRLKKEGVKAGVPDLHLPIAKGGWAGLWIEMKSPTGKASDNQKAWHTELIRYGHKVVICKSAGEAIAVIEEYLR